MNTYFQLIFFLIICLSNSLYSQNCKEQIYKVEKLFNAGDYEASVSLAESYYDSCYDHIGINDTVAFKYPYFLGFGFSRLGEFKKAEKYFTIAQQFTLKHFGEKSLIHTDVLNGFGGMYSSLQKYDKALIYQTRALSLLEELIGTNNEKYLLLLVNMGIVHDNLFQYEKSTQYLNKANNLAPQIIDKSNINFWIIKALLANSYKQIGLYSKAEDFYQQSILNLKLLLGEEHPYYNTTISSLAGLYQTVGKYEKALPLLIEILDRTEAKYGKKHLTYQAKLQTLANLYSNMSQFESATKLYLQCREIVFSKIGSNNRSYIQLSRNLAVVNLRQKNYKKALQYLNTALSICKELYGKNHSLFGDLLFNKGSYYYTQNNYRKALKYYNKSLKIIKHNQGINNIDYAKILSNISAVHFNKKKYKKSLLNSRLALSIVENQVGSQHPIYRTLINRIGDIYIKQNQPILAYDNYFKSAEALEQQLKSGFYILNEQQRTLYLKSEESSFNRYFTFYVTHHNLIEHQLSGDAYNTSMFLKEQLLNNSKAVRSAIFNHPEASLHETFTQWSDTKSRLVFLHTRNPPNFEKIDSLTQVANHLEQKLVINSRAFRNANKKISWKEVRDHLKDGEVAIEFFHYSNYFKNENSTNQYCALILKKDASSPILIPLFEEEELNKLLTKNTISTSAFVNKLYVPALYKLIWQPLEPFLKNIKTVYYSPTGLLHKISFPAILVDGVRLVDRYNIQYLGSTRNLVFRDSLNKQTSISNAIIYGGIEYDLNNKGVAGSNNSNLRSEEEYYLNDINLMFGDFSRGKGFGPLDTTKVELNHLDQIFKLNRLFTMTLTDSIATEESFKVIGQKYPSPHILHIATHGFFFPDSQLKSHEQNQLLLGNRSNFKYSDNPLFRSGLILAGANQAWKEGKSIPGVEDGILTAYEISNMDLSNTKLVVLSACKTGLGDIQGSEGVYGLQRAFKMAGVDHLILTLWNIPDSRHTVEFMESFYTNWLSNKLSISEAFNLTQKEMREKFKDPYYWAGFVLIE